MDFFFLEGGGLSIHQQTSQSFEKIKSLPLNNLKGCLLGG